jgi:hypothetical protein
VTGLIRGPCKRWRSERATLLRMTIGTMIAARAIVSDPDFFGGLHVTLVVSDAGDSSESHEMGTYYSRARAQFVADFVVGVLTRKAKQSGSFSSEEVREAVLSSGGTTGGLRL